MIARKLNMNRVRPQSALPHLLPGLLLFWLGASVEAAPAVSSISPDVAGAGDVLDVKGTGFKGTREVLFVSGLTIKPAKFKVLQDGHLEVIFPEYYRGTGSASIVVVGMDSVTVAMSEKMMTIDVNTNPKAAAPFLNVVKNGIVSRTSGITVVGNDAIVGNSTSSAICFVKNKGTLAEFHGSIIFHEPGALFGDKLKSMATPLKLIPVHEITISPNIEPVLIRSPEAPQPFASHPPVLTSITPSLAIPGDVVELKGRNFSRVSNIYFANTPRGPIEAGFKAITDDVLRVEIPQQVSGRQLIVVMNPAGIAVNIAENPSPPFQPLDRQSAQIERVNSARFMVEYVRNDQIETSGRGSRIFVIDKGGIVTSAGGSCCFLVRNGGRLGAHFGGSCAIFHETDAIVPFEAGAQPLPAAMKTIDVGKINFCQYPSILDIVNHF